MHQVPKATQLHPVGGAIPNGDGSAEPPAAAFRSILFEDPPRSADDGHPAPEYFGDLNLDRVVEAVTRGRAEYDLRPFFHMTLHSVDAVSFRQEVFRDVEREEVSSILGSFADAMRAMRRRLAQGDQLRYAYQRQRWFLDAVATYCEAITRLAAGLGHVEPRSRGLLGFREYVSRYAASAGFASLQTETSELKTRLSELRYTLQIRGSRVTVGRFDGETDYSNEIREAFSRFRQGEVRDRRTALPSGAELDHVEAAVLQRVAQLHPEIFATLAEYCEIHAGYLDEITGAFDREVQFYLGYTEYIGRLRAAELAFCHPRVSVRSKHVYASETFDLALADVLVADGAPVVGNSFSLDGPERVFVVTGPNQGGKTTFARTFGQLHHLAGLGCPVPGTGAELFLCDEIFTHFEREETIEDMSGKLQSDLLRIRETLERATPRSVVIMNESFSSTTLDDALFLGTNVLERIIALDLLCVCVTFVDELSTLGESAVSMVSGIAPGDPARRSYKIERRPADGLAYAVVLAEQHGLTYDALKARVAT